MSFTIAHPCGYKEMREGTHPPNTITALNFKGGFSLQKNSPREVQGAYFMKFLKIADYQIVSENAEVGEYLFHFLHSAAVIHIPTVLYAVIGKGCRDTAFVIGYYRA